MPSRAETPCDARQSRFLVSQSARQNTNPARVEEAKPRKPGPRHAGGPDVLGSIVAARGADDARPGSRHAVQPEFGNNFAAQKARKIRARTRHSSLHVRAEEIQWFQCERSFW